YELSGQRSSLGSRVATDAAIQLHGSAPALATVLASSCAVTRNGNTPTTTTVVSRTTSGPWRTRSCAVLSADYSDPSLRWLDTQIHKSWGNNRIHDVSWRHVSMAGRGRVPHRTLRESSSAGAHQGCAGFRLSVRSPVYFAQSSSRASGSAPPVIGPGYGESSATSAGNGSQPPAPAAPPAHRASHGR